MRSPIKREVAQVFIPVRDMKAAVGWYAELLGFDFDHGRLSHGDTIFELPMDSGPSLCLDANQPDFIASGPARFFFMADDVAATVQHVTEMGASDVSGPEDIGSVSFVTFRDPDGNLLMVCAPN